MVRSRFIVIAALTLPASYVGAQGQPAPAAQPTPAQRPQIPRAAPSTRATVEVLVSHRALDGRWINAAAIAGPARIAIEYGQPHLRGRSVIGMPGVVPWDSVWRTGANLSTQLRTEVDITIGNAFIPRGIYSLFTLPTRNGWKLIVNKQTLHWGTEYDPSQDLARIDLRARTLPEPVESLTFWLVPAVESSASTALPSGTLKFAWGSVELSTGWRVGR